MLRRIVSALGSIVEWLSGLLGFVSYQWAKIDGRVVDLASGAAMAPRDGAGLLWFANKLFVLGGWNSGVAGVWSGQPTTNEVWSSADGTSWTLNLIHDDTPPIAATRWRRRHTAGWIVHRGYAAPGVATTAIRMFVVGGDHLDSEIANEWYGMPGGAYPRDVWRSDDGLAWELVTNDAQPFRPVETGPPAESYGRMLHAVGSFNNQVWVFGGSYDLGNAAHMLNDLWSSYDGATWVKRAAEGPRPSPRGMIYDLVEWSDENGFRCLCLCGGGTYAPDAAARTCHNDVWYYYPFDPGAPADRSDRWRQILPDEGSGPFTRWAPREYHSVAVFDRKLWVMSGYNTADGNHNDVWYSANGVDWTQLASASIWNRGHADGVCVSPAGLWHCTGNGTFVDGIVDVWLLRKVSWHPVGVRGLRQP